MKPNQYTKLPGAKFVIIDCNGTEIACGTTDSCGKLVFDCLPFGTYYIKELVAPCGYKKTDATYKVSIGCDSEHACIDIINEQKKGSITINKLGC